MSPEKNLSPFENYTIGAITGGFEVLATHPLWTIKTKIQQGAPVPRSFRGLYAGVITNALSFMPIMSIQNGASQWLENHLERNTSPATQKIASAFSAGALSAVVSCPVELIMTVQNKVENSPFIQTTKHHIKTQGAASLFKGFAATALREGIFSTSLLTLMPWIKNQLKDAGQPDGVATLLTGIGVGIPATLLSQPMDTIKTIQQSNHATKFGFFKTVQQVGVAHLFKGTLARSSNIVLSLTLMSWMKEQLEALCSQQQPCKPQ